DVKGIECNDLAFNEAEMVKCIFQKKMGCNGFPVVQIQSDHMQVLRSACSVYVIHKTQRFIIIAQDGAGVKSPEPQKRRKNAQNLAGEGKNSWKYVKNRCILFIYVI